MTPYKQRVSSIHTYLGRVFLISNLFPLEFLSTRFTHIIVVGRVPNPHPSDHILSPSWSPLIFYRITRSYPFNHDLSNPSITFTDRVLSCYSITARSWIECFGCPPIAYRAIIRSLPDHELNVPSIPGLSCIDVSPDLLVIMGRVTTCYVNDRDRVFAQSLSDRGSSNYSIITDCGSSLYSIVVWSVAG